MHVPCRPCHPHHPPFLHCHAHTQCSFTLGGVRLARACKLNAPGCPGWPGAQPSGPAWGGGTPCSFISQPFNTVSPWLSFGSSSYWRHFPKELPGTICQTSRLFPTLISQLHPASFITDRSQSCPGTRRGLSSGTLGNAGLYDGTGTNPTVQAVARRKQAQAQRASVDAPCTGSRHSGSPSSSSLFPLKLTTGLR